MKKLLALLCLALCAVLFTATAPAFAEEAERETFTSGDFEYALLDDGTAEITKYGGNADVLTLPDALDGHAVTAIGDYAFYECYKLTSATIPDSVTSIGDGAFCQCWYLTSVTIPDSVTSIGDYAFCNCEYLTSVTIPDSVTSIGDLAFSCCFKLTSVTIPDSVTSIGDWAFSFCHSLTSVTIPDSVTSIGANPFAHCSSLTLIAVSPDHPALAVLDGVLFSMADKRLVCYPCAFTASSYSVPQGVESIGDEAFSGCKSLTSVTIPDSVTYIGANPFKTCHNLTDIVVSPDHPVLAVIDGVLFSKADKRLVCYPYAFTASSYSVPQGVESIGDSAFSGCYELTSVAIPDSVTFIGKAAFSGCVWLKSVTIPDSVTSIGDIAFLGCESLTLTVGRDSYAEEYCIENGLKYAGANG